MKWKIFKVTGEWILRYRTFTKDVADLPLLNQFLMLNLTFCESPNYSGLSANAEHHAQPANPVLQIGSSKEKSWQPDDCKEAFRYF